MTCTSVEIPEGAKVFVLCRDFRMYEYFVREVAFRNSGVPIEDIFRRVSSAAARELRGCHRGSILVCYGPHVIGTNALLDIARSRDMPIEYIYELD
jgi:hypothetical protein